MDMYVCVQAAICEEVQNVLYLLVYFHLHIQMYAHVNS